MALYFIGDLQSCCTPFKSLLEKIDFSPSTDELILLGDMLNRGPQSLETLETILSYGGAIRCLLGNHDLHFLSVAYGLRKELPHDTLRPILESPHKKRYMDWMREQHMALYTHGWLAVHAGVMPQWTLEQTLGYATEIEQILRSHDVKPFLQKVFSNEPNYWHDDLTGIDRHTVIVNALTRIRFCDAEGRMNMTYKQGLKNAPEHLTPWFMLPNRKTQDIPIAFGHWSTLETATPANNVFALDTGCLWGGKLTAAKIKLNQTSDKSSAVELIQVSCQDVGIQPL